MQAQKQLFGKLGTPINRPTGSDCHHTVILDEPHENRATAHLSGEVMGWSKVKQRLGKEKLEEGDAIIITSYRLATGSIAVLEIC